MITRFAVLPDERGLLLGIDKAGLFEKGVVYEAFEMLDTIIIKKVGPYALQKKGHPSEMSDVNAHQEAMSEIQKAKSRTCWIDFDIDKEGVDLDVAIAIVKQSINIDAVTWLKTRGGIHALVNPEKIEQQYKNTFYQKIGRVADQSGDQMIPVPGCTQGNFIPHFITL